MNKKCSIPGQREILQVLHSKTAPITARPNLHSDHQALDQKPEHSSLVASKVKVLRKINFLQVQPRNRPKTGREHPV